MQVGSRRYRCCYNEWIVHLFDSLSLALPSNFRSICLINFQLPCFAYCSAPHVSPIFISVAVVKYKKKILCFPLDWGSNPAAARTTERLTVEASLSLDVNWNKIHAFCIRFQEEEEEEEGAGEGRADCPCFTPWKAINSTISTYTLVDFKNGCMGAFHIRVSGTNVSITGAFIFSFSAWSCCPNIVRNWLHFNRSSYAYM